MIDQFKLKDKHLILKINGTGNQWEGLHTLPINYL